MRTTLFRMLEVQNYRITTLYSIAELQSNAESRVDSVAQTLNTWYRGRSWTECRVQNNRTLHGLCKMKKPTDGRDFSHSKYAKMTGPADGAEQACCRVEQTLCRIELTRWRSRTLRIKNNWVRRNKKSLSSQLHGNI